MSIPVLDLIVAAELNIKCYRGNTFSVILKLYDDAAKTIPTNLTGSNLKLDVLDVKNQVVVLSFATGGQGLTIQNTNEIVFLKTAVQMQVNAGTFKYDLLRTYVDTVTKYTQCYGTFEIIKNIS